MSIGPDLATRPQMHRDVAAHREATATIIGAARDVGPVVRLGYGSLRRTTSGESPVIVADNGCDAEAVAYLSAQDWIRLVSLEERIAGSDAAYEESVAILESIWSRIRLHESTFAESERRVAAAIQQRVKAQPPPDVDDLAQLGETIDWMLPEVTTRYAVLVDSDVEFRHPGWLHDIIEMMDEQSIDLFGFPEPVRHPIQERFATYILAMRAETIRGVGCSFATSLVFDDDADRERWHAQSHSRFLDTTAFNSYPSARFYDTASRVYHAALQNGLRCEAFPEAWRDRFYHLGHMAWSGQIDDSYARADDLRGHRSQALQYAESRCGALGIGLLA